jgi:hypothetical protein
MSSAYFLAEKDSLVRSSPSPLFVETTMDMAHFSAGYYRHKLVHFVQSSGSQYRPVQFRPMKCRRH